MNYIPGFSNYLQASVPRYAKGGPARFAGEDIYDGGYEAEPYQYTPTIQPVTQEAAAPYDMGGLGSLDFSGLYGGYEEAPYQPLPAVQPMTQEAAPAEALYQPLPAAQPMTQEATPAEAPYDLSSLAGLDLSGLGGLNFSGFGGGRMGGVLQNDPNQEYITAPISNKGNPTGRMGGNVFTVTPEQPVRLVDHRTNQVVFEGTGYDAARKATELGQGLTDQFGRKANYSIQTADPTGAYNTVAYEKKNKSTLGTIANVAGTVLPLAMIPLTAGASAGSLLASTAGKIGLGTALGAAGAGLKGDNILKGAVMGGLSSAGGALLGGPIGDIGASNLGLRAGTAIGTGLGATAGGLATGQSLKNSLLGGVASGALSYVTPDIAKGLGIGQTPSTSTSTSGSAPSGSDIVVSATPAVTPINLNTSLGGSPNKIQQALAQGSEVPYDGITAIGNRLGGLSAVNFGGNQFGAPGQDTSAFDRLTDPNEILVKAGLEQPASLSPDVLAGMAEFGRNPIVAEASKLERPTSVSPDVLAGLAEFERNPIVAEASKLERPTSTLPPLDLGLIDRISGMENYAEKPIDVIGSKIIRSTPVGVSVVPPLDPLPPLDLKSDPTLTDKKKIGLEEVLRIAGLGAGLIGGAAGGSRQTSRYGGGGGLQNIFSARLPSASGIFSSKNLAPRDMSGTDFLRYGYGPEKSFFQNVPTNAGERDRLVNEFRPSSLPLSAMYDPEALRQDALRQLAIGAPIEAVLDALLLNATPQEIEFYTKTPKGQQELVRLLGGSSKSGTSNPSMYVPDDMRFAEGGAFAAKRGGSSKRTEFAVNGPGTGRSDDIPAVLSDGEYVIDAETVALLGDGSSKAGAKKLDELRVKVRKHKGQKLAKGRFSAKAKNPEAYLSGGRV
jgi:hypothetical protein